MVGADENRVFSENEKRKKRERKRNKLGPTNELLNSERRGNQKA